MSPRINQITNISSLGSVAQLTQALPPILQNLQQTVNGLGLNDLNLNIIGVTFSSGGVQVTVPHGLGYIPNGYFPIQLNAGAVIYNSTNPGLSGNALTATNAYLMASTVCIAQLIFF
jgi:hypothetical protein